MGTQRGGARFFFPLESLTGELSPEEAHHLVNVLRKREGDEIKLIDGKGYEFLGKIQKIQKKGKELKVIVKKIKILRKEEEKLPKSICFLPILKGDKTEMLVEKLTEIGIKKFVIFQSDTTIAKIGKNLQKRVYKKAISALKQSGRLYLPEFLFCENLFEFLSSKADEFFSEKDLRFWAYENGKWVKEIFPEIREKREIEHLFLISGPEGGFSQREKELFFSLNFIPLKLSPYILRAETASFLLAALLSLFYD